MSHPVKLYVYDLSRGMARQMSQQLIGKQIEGIWHTSVVVFGKEVFYGQGIFSVAPGHSRYGRPMQMLDMGYTDLDEETWKDYLEEMRLHYTAEKYHIIEFNCNSFTNDCVGFLTGGSIPDFIRDLPSDFLSTPLGAALRPMIDSMFPPRDQESTAPSLPSQVDSGFRSMSLNGGSSSAAPPTSGSANTLTSPIHVCTNPASMQSILQSHRAVVAFFTSATCGPCRMIEPVFESLAEEKTRGADRSAGQVAFVKVDHDVGLGGAVAREYGVRVTPTFIFFLDGRKTDELKGANASELRNQVNFLLYQAFPPHPHTSLSLPVIESLSTDPILFTQVPDLEKVLAKLISFIDSAPRQAAITQVKQLLSGSVIPYLKSRFGRVNKTVPPPDTLWESWSQGTLTLCNALRASELFPLVDLWRLAVLDSSASTWCAKGSLNPVLVILKKAASISDITTDTTRNYALTTLRLLSNSFSNALLAGTLLSNASSAGEDLSPRTWMTDLLLASFFSDNTAVRTAAASVAFNIAAYIQKDRVSKLKEGRMGESDEDGDWEMEMISALLEKIRVEDQSEEVVHRLTASLAFLLRFSPFQETLMMPLLEVLEARSVLKSKLVKGGLGSGVVKKEVGHLISEVADQLCP